MYRISLPAQSNRASWAFTGIITDLDDNPIDLTGLTLVFSIFDKRGCPRLSAQTTDGSITLIGLGQFRWFFTLQQMMTLGRDTYPVGMTMQTADQSQTIQLFTGYLPIIGGNMPPACEVMGDYYGGYYR
jgi:hypothetical protein